MLKQEEPETEKKTSDCLIPFLMKDYPYPIMWVPPGFMNTDSNRKHTHDRVPLNESKEKDKEKHTHDRIPLGPLEPLKQGRNGETERKQPAWDDNNLERRGVGNICFYVKQSPRFEDDKHPKGKVHHTLLPKEITVPTDNRLPFPIFWFRLKNNEVGEKNVKESPSARSDDKKREAKINDEAELDTGDYILVKQLGSIEEKNHPKSIETQMKSASVEKTDNGIEGKASPKTPKLPPVCLRVDPLPRKKNSTSRSLHPLSDDIRSKGSTINESRSSQQQTQLSEGLKKSNEEKSENAIKTIKVVESDFENVPKGSGKKKLSENEAALIVRSACRGFQPITKLRQIAEVGKRVIELRNRIRDRESCCFDSKEKLGLHPVVREVRKCVAKELVGLQEKLDSLKPETPIEQPTTKRVKDDDADDESPNTNLELQKEERGEEVKNKQPLDDVIQDKLGGKDDDDDDINVESETQSDSKVESAMINSDDNQTVPIGEVNKDKQLLDDVIKDKLPQTDGNGESGGKDDDAMEQKVAEENSKGEMCEQAADAIQAESGTNVDHRAQRG
ncbi:hypothetical protein OSB04_010962 [Centaurea solstitialis]|uniref:Uncharacterized protein n=1 Tax=Centaurea solstitialis TaxID=347529 RepID=A0AA38T8J5_9ASTR|nr:hypothetical protein OSB04_010962 [Centaurea solstitialis]